MLAAALLLVALPLRAAVPSFELVYSYPAETSLEEPDLRQTHDVWPQMIDAARQTLDIEQFYVVNSTGGRLEATIQAIERAAKRGVRVRFMMEKFFFKLDPKALSSFERLASIPGVEARAVDWTALNGAGIIHCKYFIVDGKTLFLGSQNFDWRSLEHIHELGVRTEEPGVVAQAQAIFERDWELSGSSAAAAGLTERPIADRSRAAYLVASPWRRNPATVGDSETELAALIASAREELAIQLLDYSAQTRSKPPRYYAPIDAALRDAALRGVKVKLLVSNWNTDPHYLHHIRSLAVMPNVEVRVATIPDPKGWQRHVPFSRVIHAKYMVVDGRKLWLGTSNWGGGYLDNSRNLELVLDDPATAARVARIHRRLWTSAYAAPVALTGAYPELVR